MRLLLLCLFIGTLLACNKPQQSTYVVWKTSYWTLYNVLNAATYAGPWECVAPDSIVTRQEIYNNKDVDWTVWKTYQMTPQPFLRDTTNHIVRYFTRDSILSIQVKDIP